MESLRGTPKSEGKMEGCNANGKEATWLKMARTQHSTATGLMRANDPPLEKKKSSRQRYRTE